MKKLTTLSIIAACALSAAEIQLAPIGVEATAISDVARKAQTSADVAQALSDSIPSIDMSRRSGIANDIILRGQKRDNISIDIDGTKVFGACPNRMDPPISHIVTNQIESIEVIEGPYDVENFGTLSGGVKIKTKKPSAREQGEINVGFGSFGYKKFGASASGGTDRVRVSAAVSTESSDQYKDGDGNTLAEQQDKNNLQNPRRYQTRYRDNQAYSKQSAMAKAFVKTFENQELRLSVTANRSSNILYANTPMDARHDNSNIYSVEYNIDDISDSYKNVNLQYYHSDVDHPMDTRFRNNGAENYRTNHLQTTMDGLKLKNNFELGEYKLLVGLDTSKRMWQGEFYTTNAATGIVNPNSISTSQPRAETKNQAAFTKLENSFGDFDVAFGARYDYTDIDAQLQESKNYAALSANLLANYNLDKESKIFLGIGQASRVPDARELYVNVNTIKGNENLKQVRNQEIDLGYQIRNSLFKFKAKAFYSMLKDFIYLNRDINTFENVDATVYGGELSGSLYATDALSFDMGASYKRGTRDTLAGQSGTNMADMAPLRANVAANYEYMNNSIASLELRSSQRWSDIDSENGEQEIGAWNIINAKIKHAVNKKFDFTFGVNNITNETYAQSNTYADLILLAGGAGDIMLLNEPGRYVYTNLDFKF